MMVSVPPCEVQGDEEMPVDCGGKNEPAPVAVNANAKTVVNHGRTVDDPKTNHVLAPKIADPKQQTGAILNGDPPVNEEVSTSPCHVNGIKPGILQEAVAVLHNAGLKVARSDVDEMVRNKWLNNKSKSLGLTDGNDCSDGLNGFCPKVSS